MYQVLVNDRPAEIEGTYWNNSYKFSFFEAKMYAISWCNPLMTEDELRKEARKARYQYSMFREKGFELYPGNVMKIITVPKQLRRKSYAIELSPKGENSNV